MRCQKCGFSNSPTAKFCKQCGMGMPRAAATGAAAPVDPPSFASAPRAEANRDFATQAAVASARSTNPGAASSQQACPQCATTRVPGKRFCRQCRFDFAALDNASPVQQPAPEPVEARREEISPVVTHAPEPQLATIDSAALTALAESATNHKYVPVAPPPHTTVDAAPAEEAFLAAAPAAAIASDAEAVEHCPQCSTARTPGKRFCRGCRFDFAMSKPIDEIPAEPVPLTTEEPVKTMAEVMQAPFAVTSPVSEARLGATTEPADTRADNAAIAAHDTASTTASAAPETAPPAMPEQRAGAPRDSGFATSSPAAQSADVQAENATDTDHHAPVATSVAAPSEDSGGKKKWIIGGVAVVVVGVAVGAGLMLRSHLAPATSAGTVASAAAAASAPFIDAASEAPAAAPASTSTPSLAATLNAPASGIQADAASATSAASPGAAIIDTRPQTQAPPQTQPQTEPQAPAPAPQAATQTPTQPQAPAQSAEPEPAPPKPHVREAPKKSAVPADANGGENATIRAAIAGSLADGDGCFSNKKFDCAISNADAVLRLDSRNAQALSLRKRARAAQQSALNSMSIE